MTSDRRAAGYLDTSGKNALWSAGVPAQNPPLRVYPPPDSTPVRLADGATQRVTAAGALAAAAIDRCPRQIVAAAALRQRRGAAQGENRRQRRERNQRNENGLRSHLPCSYGQTLA